MTEENTEGTNYTEIYNLKLFIMKKTLLSCLLLSVALATMAQPGGGGGTPGGGGSSTTSSPSGATYSLNDGSTVTLDGQTYSTTSSDYNVIQVTSGTLNLNKATLTKSGDTSNEDGSSFYGINSSVYVNGTNAVINMTGGNITSSCKGANGGFAYGSGVLNISDVTIHNTGNLSRGIHATGGGTIVANNLNITTEGANSSVVATDRGGGTVTVTDGSYVTTGTDCAILYSTGTITANNATGSSAKGEVGVIEGDNTITINNCDFTSGSSSRGLMILQSGSGDSQGYNGKITINGGKITLTTTAPLCEVPTVITGTLTMKDVDITMQSDTLMKVDYNKRWENKYGGTGNLILQTGSSWTVKGIVYKDSYAKAVNVTVGQGVTWELTANTAVDTLVNNGTIVTNGYTLTATSTSGSGTQVTTSISNVTDSEKAIQDNKIYNLEGQYVGTDLNSLPAGVYIVNGKKFITK